MATTSQKWLIGCGIGCAVIIVLIVGLVTGAVVYVRGKFQPLREATDSHNRLVTAYGAPEAFIPPADGAISRERMEAFLSVRDSLKDAQARMDAALANFDFERLDAKRPSFWTVLGILNDVSNLLTLGGEYVNRRNRALSDKRMGLGEYAYIYSISYHSWLGHSPEEGPTILAKLRDRERVRASADNPLNPESIRRQYRRLILRLLRNQLDSMKGAEETNWRRALEEEIDRIDRNFDRIAWQDNIPPQIEEHLKPYRSRLEADYHPSSNCFELLTLNEARQFEWNGPEIRGEIRTGRGTAGGSGEPLEAVPGSGGEMRERAGGEIGSGDISYVVGGGVKAPVPILQPAPAYTEEARKARAEGVVAIRVMVRKDGSVGNLKVIRGLGFGLDESAINTIAKKWKFQPGTLNGVPVDVHANIEVTFRLH